MNPKVSQIDSTSEYSIFKSHGEQPFINPSHVRKLVISMKQNGFIQAKPLHVYRDGKTLRIIDGHHRLEAAKRLSIPVFYVIGHASQSNLIAPENFAVRKWGKAEFVNMYATRKIPDYLLLSDYVRRGIPITQAVALLSGNLTNNGSKLGSIEDGTWTIKSTDTINAVLEIMDALKPISSEAGSRVFIGAVAVLCLLQDFDRKRLIERIRSNPQALTKCATRDQMLAQLEEIYNFRMKDKVALAFLAKEETRRRLQDFLSGRYSKKEGAK